MSNLSLDPAPWEGGNKGNAGAFERTVRHGGFFAVSVRRSTWSRGRSRTRRYLSWRNL